MSFDEGLAVGYALGRKKSGKITGLDITEAGTYTAGEGDYESFTGFSPVTVKVKRLSVTKNGTYTTENTEYAGFNPVKVNVPDSYFDDGYKEGYKAAYKELTGEDYTDDITVPSSAYYDSTIANGGSVYSSNDSCRVARIEFIQQSPAMGHGTVYWNTYDKDGNLIQTRYWYWYSTKFQVLNWWVQDGWLYVIYCKEDGSIVESGKFLSLASSVGFTASGVGGQKQE